mgnify:CR=1 FL=1
MNPSGYAYVGRRESNIDEMVSSVCYSNIDDRFDLSEESLFPNRHFFKGVAGARVGSAPISMIGNFSSRFCTSGA